MVYNPALASILKGDIVFDTDDIRIALLMTNTTADTETDGIVNLSDFTTLDEADATGYARQALASEAVNTDNTNDRAEFDAADDSFTGLGGDASRNYQGLLLYKHVDGTNANDIAIAYIPFSSALNSTATQVDIPFDAEGILQLANAA